MAILDPLISAKNVLSPEVYLAQASTPYQCTGSERLVCVASSAAFSVLLPDITDLPFGWTCTFIKTTAAGGGSTVTVSGTQGDVDPGPATGFSNATMTDIGDTITLTVTQTTASGTVAGTPWFRVIASAT